MKWIRSLSNGMILDGCDVWDLFGERFSCVFFTPMPMIEGWSVPIEAILSLEQARATTAAKAEEQLHWQGIDPSIIYYAPNESSICKDKVLDTLVIVDPS